MRMNLVKNTKWIRNKDKKAKRIAFWSSFAFVLVYLFSIENILFNGSGFSFVFSSNWMNLFFSQRVAFLFEPIGQIVIWKFVYLISIPNLVLGMVLGFFVYLNILIAVFTYRMPKVCNIRGKPTGLLALLPSLLTGFACCAPTFLLALGPLLSAALIPIFIDLRIYLIPTSIVLMFLSYYFMLKKIPEDILNG